MKTTATISQEELEQKAVDSMIAYEKSLISGQEMKEAVTRALHHYANRETAFSEEHPVPDTTAG